MSPNHLINQTHDFVQPNPADGWLPWTRSVTAERVELTSFRHHVPTPA
jgi:hypothetical protein